MDGKALDKGDLPIHSTDGTPGAYISSLRLEAPDGPGRGRDSRASVKSASRQPSAAYLPFSALDLQESDIGYAVVEKVLCSR